MAAGSSAQVYDVAQILRLPGVTRLPSDEEVGDTFYHQLQGTSKAYQGVTDLTKSFEDAMVEEQRRCQHLVVGRRTKGSSAE